MHIGLVECNVPFFCHCDIDLVSTIILSRAYLLYYLGKESQFGECLHLGMTECHMYVPGFGSL